MELMEWSVTGFVRPELVNDMFPAYRGMPGTSLGSITPLSKQSEVHQSSEWDCLLIGEEGKCR